MPFLAPLLPAVLGGAASAGAGAIVNGLTGPGGGQAPGAAPLIQGASAQQAQDAAGQVSSGLNQQQDFINATQAQNGLGNQSSVFNQLQGVASGQGPNPAQAALAQATGANVANQASLMAGQRGAGANAGLIARQAGMQGGNIQQQAAGQGATLQAQQSLGALNQMGGIAGQQVGQQQNALGQYQQTSLNNQQQLQQAIAAQNATAAGQQQNINTVQGAQNLQAQHATQGLVGGAVGGVGTALAGMVTPAPNANPYNNPWGASTVGTGGVRPQGAQGPSRPDGSFAEGGAVGAQQGTPQTPAAHPNGPQSNAGRHLKGGFHAPVKYARGGQAPVVGEQLAAQGKLVPGKAKVKGNSYANDTVDAKLSPGEVVIPRSVMQSADPAGNSAKFVAAIMAKNGMRR